MRVRVPHPRNSDWRVIAKGLGRMFQGEVLGKFPVIQHLPFGTLLPWPE